MRKIILCLILFCSAGLVMAEEDSEIFYPQNELPEHYPSYDDTEKGLLTEISLQEGILVINGVFYKFDNNAKVRFISTPYGALSMLNVGDSIMFNMNNKSEIKEIWVLPESLKADKF